MRRNLPRLACRPGGLLLTEGELVLATEGDTGDLERQVLHAIASGRTKFNEIDAAVRADPGRVLDRLVSLRLVERLVPVTEDPRRTRRRVYRIADNFLAFWLGVLDRYRGEIERGLGTSILPVLVTSLNDHMGGPWEEAFRMHLRRLADDKTLGDDIVAVGPFWTAEADPREIDAVALAGRSRTAVAVGGAKRAKRVEVPASAGRWSERQRPCPGWPTTFAISLARARPSKGLLTYWPSPPRTSSRPNGTGGAVTAWKAAKLARQLIRFSPMSRSPPSRTTRPH